MVGASNAFNQIIEKDLDALMDRTKTNLCLLAGCRVTALIIASLLTLLNCVVVYNQSKQHMFGLFQYFVYKYLHTLKTMTSLSVFVGAFPGAIYFMLGYRHGRIWNRSRNFILIQFFGNPHFWAIGWFCMKIERLSLCCLQVKKIKAQRYRFYIHSLVDFGSLFLFWLYRAFIYYAIAAVIVFLLGFGCYFTQ
jgi:protoheme IX farnesyltransferase